MTVRPWPGGGYVVYFLDKPVALVHRRQTSVTGFKNGRCIGQVSVQRWFYRRIEDGVPGREEGNVIPGFGASFRTQKQALEHLSRQLAKGQE